LCGARCQAHPSCSGTCCHAHSAPSASHPGWKQQRPAPPLGPLDTLCNSTSHGVGGPPCCVCLPLAPPLARSPCAAWPGRGPRTHAPTSDTLLAHMLQRLRPTTPCRPRPSLPHAGRHQGVLPGAAGRHVRLEQRREIREGLVSGVPPSRPPPQHHGLHPACPSHHTRLPPTLSSYGRALCMVPRVWCMAACSAWGAAGAARVCSMPV
jgi:hypothetical protein